MKHLKYIITAMVFVLVTNSCEILDQPPQTAVTPELAFVDAKASRAALTGLYSRLQREDYYGSYQQYTADNYADISRYLGFFVGFQEPDLGAIPPQNDNITRIWLAAFQAVNVANEIIDNVPLSPDENFSQEERGEIMAAAKSIRALAYLDLLTQYGEFWDSNSQFGVPLVTKSTGSNFANIEQVARGTVGETYSLIISDLTEAISVLPDNNERKFVSKAFAQGLLARTYLYQGNYAQAAASATEVINNPDYSLNTTYAGIFNVDLTSESIFELVYNTLDPSTLALYTIRRDEVRPEPGLVSSFLPGDQRRAFIAPVSGFNGERFVKAEDFSNDTNPAYIMRLSEMYLIRAEANIRLNNLDDALADINRIHTRAGLTAYTSTDNIETKLLNEIKWEFFAEGHRFRALARLDKVTEVLGYAAFRRIYPIPFRELNIEGTLLVQNPGY
jgi:tetratricopeptide (TPR) repeat protein